MRIPLWLKVAWSVWVVVWVAFYRRQYGAQNFLFFCDLENLFLMLGLWLESALIFSWQATGLLLFQALYTLDLVGACVTGSHFIGGTEYMFDTHISLFIRLLSLFHIVCPPLLLWGIWRLGYERRGWRYQTLTTWIVVPINYFWRPQFDVNWARGPFFREQHFMPGLLYLLLYLIVVPLVVYLPTHLLLQWWARRGGFLLTGKAPAILTRVDACK
jgi:hypothetical protein